MKTGNLVTEAIRHSDTGQCWEELITNTQTSVELPKRTAFRVRAVGATTVTIDSVLAMTMMAFEIAIFNTGDGDPDSTKNTITVAIAGANGYLQVARETYRKSLTK